jgi:outer membrane immunogenic protein
MNKLALAVSILAITAAAASAADMAPAPVYSKAPPSPPVPVYNWTGFYIGGDVGGYDANQSAATIPYPSPGFGAPAVVGAGLAGFGQTPTYNSLNSSGVLGGVYAGYNWQWSSVVVGIEGDVSALNRNVANTQISSATFPGVPVPDFNMTATASNDWLASLRGRIGFTTGPALFYATGGAAWTKTSYSASALGFNNPPNITALAGAAASTAWSDSRTGFAVGAGVEAKLPGNPNWVFRAEYLYYQFQGSTSAMGTLGSGLDVCAPGACGWNVNTSKLEINTGRVGVSYLFGGPVVAKY